MNKEELRKTHSKFMQELKELISKYGLISKKALEQHIIGNIEIQEYYKNNPKEMFHITVNASIISILDEGILPTRCFMSSCSKSLKDIVISTQLRALDEFIISDINELYNNK